MSPEFGLPCKQKDRCQKCWTQEVKLKRNADNFGRAFFGLDFFFGGGSPRETEPNN